MSFKFLFPEQEILFPLYLTGFFFYFFFSWQINKTAKHNLSKEILSPSDDCTFFFLLPFEKKKRKKKRNQNFFVLKTKELWWFYWSMLQSTALVEKFSFKHFYLRNSGDFIHCAEFWCFTWLEKRRAMRWLKVSSLSHDNIQSSWFELTFFSICLLDENVF